MLPKTWKILIPVYNEEKTIKNIIKQLNRNKLSFWIINDGSTDRTLDIIYRLYANYLTYKTNKGKGYAIKYGAKYLISNLKTEYILLMDGDGQCSIKDIPIFVEALKRRPGAKIIIGNRLHNPVGMPLIRLYINKLMSWFISLLVRRKILDSQCGFRLVHKDVFLKIPLNSNRFEFESEMLIKAGWLGYEIVNVPIKCIYNKERKSKINPLKDSVRFFKMLWDINLALNKKKVN